MVRIEKDSSHNHRVINERPFSSDSVPVKLPEMPVTPPKGKDEIYNTTGKGTSQGMHSGRTS